MGFGFGFSAFDVMFVLMFGVILVLFIVTAVRGISTWSKNNHSPRLTVEATVVSKRQNTSVHHHNNAGDATGAHGIHTTTSTTYYATFQVASGDRMELHVGGREYGMLAEGDAGLLTFQGTRFVDFQRQGTAAAQSTTKPVQEDAPQSRERRSWDPEL